ncbi:MAG TPA: prepilin-type N-terminal cleavage/methylation domain-containing protein [Deinococcales bacterium]|nr:prepilin-type N-terminal cleavage/methylation domain-containing protein [Deinococcales bacterium]
MKASGFTLIEVLVALTVLAVGLAGIAALQLSALRLGTLTVRYTALLQTAENELRHRLLSPEAGSTCTTSPGSGATCAVAERSCRADPDALQCGVPAGPLEEVSVTVTPEEGEPLVLTGYRLSGAAP